MKKPNTTTIHHPDNSKLYHSEATMPEEEDWDELAGTTEKIESPKRRRSLLRALGKRAAGLFGSRGKKPEGWPEQNGDWYDFPEDSLAEAPTASDTPITTTEPESTSEELETPPEPEFPQPDPGDAKELLKAAEQLESRKHDRFESQRVQELIERELNDKLTTVEKLEEAVISEDPGIAKREIEYHPEGGQPVKIAVYDLKGLPFTFISHAVDYRKAHLKTNGPNHIGTKTFQDVVENPVIWTETREQAQKAEGYGTQNANARGNTISCSYTNSETNPDSRIGSSSHDESLVYGFASLRPDSILYLKNDDGGTNNANGESESSVNRGSLVTLQDMEDRPTPRYNEALLRRYDESGQPLRPSYIIAVDGVITDVMLRHAAFFNIPIINVESEIYRKKLDKAAEAAFEAITPESTYEEIDAAYSTAARSPQYYHLTRRKSYGRKYDENGNLFQEQRIYSSRIREKIIEVKRLEFEKRLDLIEAEMTKEAEVYERANTENRVVSPPYQSKVDAYHNDNINCIQTQTFADSKYMSDHVPGTPNQLAISLKMGNHTVKLFLFDGEHPYAKEEALKKGSLSQEDLDQADSGPYLRIKPIFDRVVAARRRNNEIRKTLASQKAA